MERIVDTMKSPFTGGKVKEVFVTEDVDFRGEHYTVMSWYYVCVGTGEKFSTTQTDSLYINDLYSQYRNHHGIPSPEEIKRIREHYGLNYRQVGTLLGFGRNKYAQYENGTLPSESNGKAIAQMKSHQALLMYLRNSAQEFGSDEYGEIFSKILAAGDYRQEMLTPYFAGIKNSINNGFVDFSMAKAQEMVKYIISKLDGCFKSKLNKCMFYADFLNFKENGKSISGLQYMAIEFGFVPKSYDTLYDNIGGVTYQYVPAHGDIAKKLCAEPFTPLLLAQQEVSVIDRVLSGIGSSTTGDIEDKSHEEVSWKSRVANHEIVPYSDAYTLIMI